MPQAAEQNQVRDHREPGWLWIDNKVFDSYAERIGAYGIAVYAALARHANTEGKCFPSLNKIATKLKMSKQGVLNALADLESHGLITRERRQNGDGSYTSTVYTLLKIKDIGGSQSGGQPLVNRMDNPSQPDGQGVVNPVDKNKTNKNKTQGTIPSSSSESYSGKARLSADSATTTATQTRRPDLTPIRETVPWILEDSAIQDLWDACREVAPDITPREVAELCALKLNQKGNQIRNAAGFLLASVPRACEGQGLADYRKWAHKQ